MEQNGQDNNSANDGSKYTTGSFGNTTGSKVTTDSTGIRNAMGSTNSPNSATSTNTRTPQRARYDSGSNQTTSITDKVTKAFEYDLAEGEDTNEAAEYTTPDSGDSTEGLPELGPEMSTFVQVKIFLLQTI